MKGQIKRFQETDWHATQRVLHVLKSWWLVEL